MDNNEEEKSLVSPIKSFIEQSYTNEISFKKY